MSTLAYAFLQKEESPTRGAKSIPGAKSSPIAEKYAVALAALIPAEVLFIHEVILGFSVSATTATTGATTVNAVINDPGLLFWATIALIPVSMALYIFPNWSDWDRGRDYARMFFPPVALLLWILLQTTSAIDVKFPEYTTGQRTVTALMLSVIFLGFYKLIPAKGETSTKAAKKPKGDGVLQD